MVVEVVEEVEAVVAEEEDDRWTVVYREVALALKMSICGRL